MSTKDLSELAAIIPELELSELQALQMTIKVAIDILTRPWHMKPGVICFKISQLNDLEITALANLISLTPGTLVLDVSEDKSTLFVHAMFLHDEDEVQDDLRQLEQRLLQVIR